MQRYGTHKNKLPVTFGDHPVNQHRPEGVAQQTHALSLGLGEPLPHLLHTSERAAHAFAWATLPDDFHTELSKEWGVASLVIVVSPILGHAGFVGAAPLLVLPAINEDASHHHVPFVSRS